MSNVGKSSKSSGFKTNIYNNRSFSCSQTNQANSPAQSKLSSLSSTSTSDSSSSSYSPQSTVKKKSGAGKITLVARGKQAALSSLFQIPDGISTLLGNLSSSTEVKSIQNLDKLKILDLKPEDLPILPQGYFWYQNDVHWSIRKWNDAPEVVLDLDVYFNKKNVLCGHNLSVNKNLLDTRVDTSIKLKNKPGSRSYAGFTTKDFANVQFTDTRGHGIAYADSCDGITKSGEKINSDSNPRNYSPEKSSRTGGSDLGQSIRNHQLEAYTRRNSGVYRELNQFDTLEQVACGLFVPSAKHMVRVLPSVTSYSLFDQNVDYKLKRNETVDLLWKLHRKETNKMPIAKVLNSKHVSAAYFKKQKFNLEPGFFLNPKLLSFSSEDFFEVGTKIFLNNKEFHIITTRKELNSSPITYTYSYYQFIGLIQPFNSVYLGDLVTKYALQEMEESDQNYASRFGVVKKIVDSMDRKINQLDLFVNDNKEVIEKILKGGGIRVNRGNSRKLSRKNDIIELASELKQHFIQANLYVKNAKSDFKMYNKFRMKINNKALEIIKGLNTKIEDDIYRTLGGICYFIQSEDKKTLDELENVIEKAEYHIKSILQILQPPKID